mmetsp:Transcript_18486/g.28529  ORF Transcript_18486/g.28529 Transcript_18486/m.28529 type:complete len:461 (+) Transcript_18486:239-1621(+)
MLVTTRQVVRCFWALYCVTCLTTLSNNVVHAFSTSRTTPIFSTISAQQHQKWRNNKINYGVAVMTRTTETFLGMEDEGKNENTADPDDTTATTSTANISPARRRKRDRFREAFGQLAKLSLEDYKWRSSVFKTNEADRLVEQSLARMMGEDPSYVRPMDASDSKIGPLGRAEKDAVVWLSKVIEEEGKRAEIIANSNGQLVRPIDLISSKQGGGMEEDDEELGPLAAMELGAVNFVNQIRDSEKERAANGVIRPKDLDETRRGPLGEAEFKAVSKFQEIRDAEKVRAQQSRLRQGEVVRPIDVPGPLGEIEMKALELFEAEQQRAKDRQENDGKLVRPKDATVQGPLGKAEAKAIDAVGRLQEEEKERLRNIQRVLEENRPMEANRDSPLGFTEAFTVGLLRGPKMFLQVADRVKELLRSEKLNDQDKKLIKEQQQKKLKPADDKEESKSMKTEDTSSLP